VVAELCAALGVTAVVLSFARKGLRVDVRVALGLLGAFVTLICGYFGVIWLYVAACNPTGACM
jgi:hypothetical protein